MTTVTMQQCSCHTGSAEINGHPVSIGAEGDSCDCGDFVYRKQAKGERCKHLLELQTRLCPWHQQTGQGQTDHQKENRICPICGAPTMPVQVAV